MSSPSQNPNFCGSSDHDISRRVFAAQSLAIGSGALLGTSGAIHALDEDGLNTALKKNGRSVILLWLAGGASQMETWDPKPGHANGGPFASIPTSVPGVHISELMPQMAKRMHHMTVIRSLATGDGGHGTGASMMLRGRRNEAALEYPDLGAVVAKELSRADSKVPDYVSFYSQTEGRGSGKLSPAFLGARYAPMNLDNGEFAPPNISRLEEISFLDHKERAQLRDLMSARFSAGRETEEMRSHAAAYARVHGLMSSESLFDIEQEPLWVRERYGPSLLGQQTLMARRMVESGVPFVRVSRAWWDSHGQNFETHSEMVPELDHVMAALMDDLEQRGMLESTLVVAFGEFGRTPKINASLGRDHFANAWSAAMFGCGLQSGAVYGKTEPDGNAVAEGAIGAGELFATILSAIGIDPEKEYQVGARPVPLVNPGILPIRELLA